jgi:hypothetical protein
MIKGKKKITQAAPSCIQDSLLTKENTVCFITRSRRRLHLHGVSGRGNGTRKEIVQIHTASETFFQIFSLKCFHPKPQCPVLYTGMLNVVPG